MFLEFRLQKNLFGLETNVKRDVAGGGCLQGGGILSCYHVNTLI